MKLPKLQPPEQLSTRGTGRRNFIRTWAAGAAGVALARPLARGAVIQHGSVAHKRPNILYINSHDTGRYVSPYGYSVPTPSLQRLAEQGILFRQAFSAAPTCSPSRASLLTGQCAHSAGMLGLVNRGFSMSDYRRHVVHTLRQCGYRSIQIGLQHIAQDAGLIGYDKVIGGTSGPENRVERVTPAAVEFLENAPKQPFYMEVGYFETHREYRKPEPEDDSRYTQPPAPLPDSQETRRDTGAFNATARKLDWGMGEVFKALDTAGLAENTLVIATTDHGIAFPRMKCFLYDGGIGVNLIMRGPGGFSGGRVCDALISQIDLFPTICDLLEIDHPDWLQGKSIMPAIRGEIKEINEEIFAEVNFHAAYEPKRAVRTRRWKYIRRYGDCNRPVLPNCDDSPSKDLWLGWGWGNRTVDHEELYDLIFDPNECNNLAGNPMFRIHLNDMRDRLDHWMQATDDPLLRGALEPPRGARLNDVNEISPDDPVHVTP